MVALKLFRSAILLFLAVFVIAISATAVTVDTDDDESLFSSTESGLLSSQKEETAKKLTTTHPHRTSGGVQLTLDDHAVLGSIELLPRVSASPELLVPLRL